MWLRCFQKTYLQNCTCQSRMEGGTCCRKDGTEVQPLLTAHAPAFRACAVLPSFAVTHTVPHLQAGSPGGRPKGHHVQKDGRLCPMRTLYGTRPSYYRYHHFRFSVVYTFFIKYKQNATNSVLFCSIMDSFPGWGCHLKAHKVT